MQPLLAERITQCKGARSLLPQSSPEASNLGPWLLKADAAAAIGMDGCGRGVNWLLSHQGIDEVAAHLARCADARLPGEEGRTYLRIADGRVLSALLSIWTPRQKTCFLGPLLVWCFADRDGNGVCITQADPVPTEKVLQPATLSRNQYEQLLDAAVPDQVLHALKGYVVPHPDWPTRQARHQAASDALSLSRSLGYCAPEDYMTVIAAVITRGDAWMRGLSQHPAVKDALRGASLWTALLEESHVPSY